MRSGKGGSSALLLGHTATVTPAGTPGTRSNVSDPLPVVRTLPGVSVQVSHPPVMPITGCCTVNFWVPGLRGLVRKVCRKPLSSSENDARVPGGDGGARGSVEPPPPSSVGSSCVVCGCPVPQPWKLQTAGSPHRANPGAAVGHGARAGLVSRVRLVWTRRLAAVASHTKQLCAGPCCPACCFQSAHSVACGSISFLLMAE